MLKLAIILAHTVLLLSIFSGTISSDDQYEKIAKSIDANQQKFIDRLCDAVKIPSVCAEPEHRNDVFKMVNWTRNLMESIGIKCQQIENGNQNIGGQTLQMGPVLFGTFGLEDPKKKTLLVYGHLDVQPAHKADGWNTDPFTPKVADGKIYGRGASDDKGMAFTWINTIETMKNLEIDIPVNIKFVFESMEECGSLGLDNILEKHKDDFLKNVDMTVISDGYCLGKDKPCLTYALRGINYYSIEISGPKSDLHSGVFGGAVYEPMNDLTWILNQLEDKNGKILIDGINDLIAPVTQEELNLYKNLDFDLETFKKDLGVKELTANDTKDLLMKRWRYPSLSIHGIQGAFSTVGVKAVIPAKVTGKFSIRTVPNMEPKKIDELVLNYLYKLWKNRNSPNKFNITSNLGAAPWLTNPLNDTTFQIATKAIEKVYGSKPDYIREGGGIPPALTFVRLTQKSLMMFPLGAYDDGAHSTNEKFDISHYVRGMKFYAAFLLELKNVI